MNRRHFIKLLSIFIPTSVIAQTLGGEGSTENSSMGKNNSRQLNIKSFGAHSNDERGYEHFDNRDIIQQVIEKCANLFLETGIRHTVLIPNGIFGMSISSFPKNNESGNIGIFCLLLKSNIIISGGGILKVFSSKYGRGAFFRILGTDKKERLSDVDICDITIDGNMKEQTRGNQANNILIDCSQNIVIKNIKCINANGTGIQIRGTVSKSDTAKNIYIINNYVDTCNRIGIQVAQFDNLIIHGNNVLNCRDNGIDIYGDLGRGVPGETNGNKFKVYNNAITNCLNGVFLETVSNGQVCFNEINGMIQSGIHVNRIHGLPHNIIIKNNDIKICNYGLSFTGDMRNVMVLNNYISDMKEGVLSFGSGHGNVSNINVQNNTFNINEIIYSIIVFNGNVVSNIDVKDNVILGSNYHHLVLNNAKLIRNGSVKITKFKSQTINNNAMK